tara:strand:+ start:3676 stop:4059 length:384 start_codon:yes stop_codon:yes gene_type:complete
MSLTNSFETHVLQYLFSTASLTRPTSWYLALYTSAPTDSSTGTELSGNGYARQSISWTISGNTATNSGAIEFPTNTGSNWGTVTSCAVTDASSSGNIIAYANLSASKTVNVGDVLRIPAGDLDVTLD